MLSSNQRVELGSAGRGGCLLDKVLTGSKNLEQQIVCTQCHAAGLPAAAVLWFWQDDHRPATGCGMRRMLPLCHGLSESADLEICDPAQGQCGQARSRPSPLSYLVDDFSEESSFYEILPCCARFRCGELVVEGQWHHLALLMSRGMLKNSTAALYLDGQLVSTVKVSMLYPETPALGLHLGAESPG